MPLPPHKVKKRRMERIEKHTPKEAIRAVCINCLGLKQFNTEDVRECEGDHVKCPFFLYRMGKRPPVKVFRTFCIDCMGGLVIGIRL